MSSLVVQTSFLGDVVLTTPLIAGLARRGPVDVLTTPEGARILRHDPHVRELIVFDRRERDRGLGGFARIVRRIRAAAGNTGYDAAYLAQGSLRSALVVTAAGIKRRVGFNTSEGSRLYTERVDYRADRHHAERLWWLSVSSCADPPSAEQLMPRLYPSESDEREVAGLLKEAFGETSRRFVALAPGSAWGTKRWPYYRELAGLLSDDVNIVVIGGDGESDEGRAIADSVGPGRALNAAGRLGILGSAALIRRAAAIVCNDSAPQHLASAMGTPTIAIFGPTVPEFGFGPLAPGSAVAGLDALACRPCDRHGPERCPLGHWRCMREVSAGQVSELLARTLSYRATA